VAVGAAVHHLFKGVVDRDGELASGMTPRRLGSTQNSAPSVRLSDIGKMPVL
jgi:hypothetical protein